MSAQAELDPLGALWQDSLDLCYHSDPKIQDLGTEFYDRVKPACFERPILRFRNQQAARKLGLAGLSPDAWQQHFALFKPFANNLCVPLALRYHGHQFGHYNPQLGDGRGFLFAQFRDCEQRLYDLGTKGSGQTPYSRQGDGRLTLKGAVRELIAAELLEALNVPTCRIISIFETEQELLRHDEPSPTRSAVMVRMNFGHIRIGTFQYLAYRFHQGEQELAQEAMSALVDYCLSEFYGQEVSAQDSIQDKAERLLKAVSSGSAALLAGWMAAGFVHGVLNSDNINISAESFDYGPYRFLPHFDPAYTAAYFDHEGRYAYARQPQAMAWNLGQLAKALTILGLDQSAAQRASKDFSQQVNQAFAQRFIERMGYQSQGGSAQDTQLLITALEVLKVTEYSWDLFFDQMLRGKQDFEQRAFQPFLVALKAYKPSRAQASFAAENPAMLCSDHASSEALWDQIAEHDNWQPLYDFIAKTRAWGQIMREASAWG